MAREIVTLQIGHFSNYVGTTLWNHLDLEQRKENSMIDYNNYFTFHPKTNLPTARALIIDYHNAFGDLFDENRNQSLKTDASVEVIQRTAEDLLWSKELKTKAKFNSKSLVPLLDHWYSSNADESQFDIYPVGQQTFKKMFDPIENSLHYLLESCDSLQSFRCLFDVQNSFSGLFTSIQDYLTDECPKQPIWSFALSDSVAKPSSNLNLSLATIQSLTVNQMPTIPCLNQSDRYFLALAIQHSLFSSPMTLDVLADRLCPMKMNLLKLFWQIPFELEGKTLYQHLNHQPIFPLDRPVACHCFLRGIDKNRLYDSSLYRLNLDISADLIDLYLNEQHGSKMFRSTYSWQDPLVGNIGLKTFDSMSILTALINDQQSSLSFFSDLLNDVKKIKYKLLSKRWQENEFEEQNFDQLMHDLQALEEQYQLIDLSN